MRVYFDENFSPHLVAGMRSFQDGRKSEEIAVSSIAEDFGRGAPDEVWIPGVAQRHGVALTQDINIHRAQAQWQLCQQNKIGIFFLKPPKRAGWNYWQIVQLVVRLWPEMMHVAKGTARPFGFAIDAGKLRFRRI